MEARQSFQGYGKVDDPLGQEAHLQKQKQRKSCKKAILIFVGVVLILGLIVGTITGVVVHEMRKSDSSGDATHNAPASASAVVKALCGVTQHKESCVSSLTQVASEAKTADPKKLFAVSLKVVGDSLTKLASKPAEWETGVNDSSTKMAFQVCREVFNDAVDRLQDSISSVGGGDDGDDDKLTSSTTISDLKTWLSSSITDQETCMDALDDIKADSSTVSKVKAAMKESTEFSSNSLAIVTHILSIFGDFKIPGINRRLLADNQPPPAEGFPEWVKPIDRRLLKGNKVKPDVIVDKTGATPGSVKTIMEAVNRVPEKSKTRFVIYVKAGEYVEKVELDKTKWNVMMYGDGIGKTNISGSANFIDGTPTFQTATLIAAGKGFVAKDMTIKNTAGPEKHQAVAMRSGSDQSVFYRCAFDAFQDTLYAHSNRQFYRECDIIGTIDFIFGNAASVFQKCRIMPRQPMANQFNTITAQGKKDPNESTGISIQKCTITPFDNVTADTYLGRPWKEYSTTVIMQSIIDGFLKPEGWIAWVTGVLPPATINYAEYQNRGPGASVGRRVKWAGYRPSLTPEEAEKYTVQNFLEGQVWMPVGLKNGEEKQNTILMVGKESSRSPRGFSCTKDTLLNYFEQISFGSPPRLRQISFKRKYSIRLESENQVPKSKKVADTR
ncbi:unnamed protein product [Cuscuta europaea]|uniref:Pectinesterase n=1 Tax=Cuscuta europaea TaxID=41803 RepID=A0A9P1A1M1_CUSEU|nr:unnamed protein product [Cuscuta europaea]